MNILIIGGNRFFGKRLARKCLSKGFKVTLLNRGNLNDDLGPSVKRIICDRTNKETMIARLDGQEFDIVYDQVCFEYNDAKAACEIFHGKVKKYIVISSQSVYGDGASIKEEVFNPAKHIIKKFETKNTNYSEAKRQIEVAFNQFASFPVICVRFPIVIGPDDFTGRFKFHVERIRSEEDIFFSNTKSKISFISSECAANSLLDLVNVNYTGGLNVCSESSISLQEMLKIIEDQVGKELLTAKERFQKNVSPYNLETDWYMNTSKAIKLGLKVRESRDFLLDKELY